MKTETTTPIHAESQKGHEEKIPNSFPIIQDKEVYYFEDIPDLQEGKIIHFERGLPNEKQQRFILLQTIGELHYIFHLSETHGGTYQLNFKTKEYEYATTNLDEYELKKLFATINALLTSTTNHDGRIDTIRISSADASYSAEDIEACIGKILSSKKNTYTREELISEYNGFRIFNLYQELFHKNFHQTHYNNQSRARGRSRLFKMMTKKYLPDWKVEDPYSLGGDFSLKKKAASSDVAVLDKQS